MARQSAEPTSNIYTILAFIALAALIAGVIYVWIRISQLGVEPFSYETEQALLGLPRALGLG